MGPTLGDVGERKLGFGGDPTGVIVWHESQTLKDRDAKMYKKMDRKSETQRSK